LDTSAPNLDRNVRLFVLFRLFFNARFYYPIFTLLFLDFGLSITDFFILNGVVWTLSSILLEVPSGALADQLGRRTLIVTAAVLMVIEMLVICATPVGGAWALVFTMFLINRIFSGAAEAAASGADEALAYDSIPEAERDTRWPKVQSQLMTVQAIGMIVALNLGAGIYGFNDLATWFGLDWTLSRELTIKIPLFLCLATSIITLIISLMMKEPPKHSAHAGSTIGGSFRRTLSAGRWILSHRAPFFILLTFVLFDSIVRLFYTVSPSYYRVIELKPAFFGLIGTFGNVIGLLVAALIGWVIANRSASFNYRFGAIFVLSGLIGLAYQFPVWGFLVLLPLGIGMRHIHAATSTYLNRVTDSEHRATVLSFRGLAMMLFYGFVNVAAIAQVSVMRNLGIIKTSAADIAENPTRGDEIIQHASPYWWMWFVWVLIGLTIFRVIVLRKPIDKIIEEKKPA
jgi:MFS family permease